MERRRKDDKPFFLWWNSTRMHCAPQAGSDGKTGLGITTPTAWSATATWARCSQASELGLDENTIIMYSTDNGAETFTWPDGGDHVRGENTRWEGGYRVPTRSSKWPGVIKPGW